VRITLLNCQCGLILILAGVLCLIQAPLANAQTQRGQIKIEVHDPGGATVSAHGLILSTGNEFQRTFEVSSEGHFTVQALPFGVYRLDLTAEGFATWTEVVEVHSEVPIKLAITLGVAPVTTQVQVSDSLTLLDPTRTGTLYTLGQQSIREQLGTQPGRDLLDLVASQPGWLFEANGVLHPRGSEYDVQFVVDGQPLLQNRSPSFAPEFDSSEVESVRVLTASYPAEYGRKLGGVVEVSTNANDPAGWHGELVAAGGSFDGLNGSLALSYVREKDHFSARAQGFHSNRYLDPPVLENFSNAGNSGDFSFGYDREISDNDRFRIFVSHSALRYSVPNDLIQQNQQLGPQRQDANSEETSGQIYFQHSISPTLFLSLSGSVRDSNFILHSNDLSTPVIVNQNRGYREGYVRGDLAGHRGHHDWKAGVDSFFTPVNEALQYRITDPSQFDPGTQQQFQFADAKWDIEPSFYVQDQMRYGAWNISAGLRFDHYSFVTSESALSPRVGVSRFISSYNLLLHFSYDRVFQTPAMENLLLASSPQLDAVNPVVLRLPVLPSTGNFFEGGVTKSFFGLLRLDANVFRRNFRNYSDDDVLLQTGVNFPIAYAHADIFGEEVRLEIPNWGRFSGFLSYSNQVGLGQGPITGGLFLGSDTTNGLTDTSKFSVSQDQRNTLRVRARVQAQKRLWFALTSQYGSGLPADLGDNPDPVLLTQQYGSSIVSHVNFVRQRVAPNFSLDLGAGAELYHKELRTVQLQFQAMNLTDHLNLINFASLFSGTAVGPPRSYSARLRFSF